jgi:RNA polymerase sigma factor (sigma-70 family)
MPPTPKGKRPAWAGEPAESVAWLPSVPRPGISVNARVARHKKVVPFPGLAAFISGMQTRDDHELLGEYVRRGSEEAFAALVGRHINKVYSVALRHARDPHGAEEITQAVFVVLARKAPSLLKHTSLAGWLFETARLASITFVRGEIRRARRHEEAFMQSTLSQTESDEAWRQMAPLLDSAIANLGAKDREAIVLRFFDGQSLRTVGTTMGASEDAAKKRVERALEKLRVFFAKRGIASTTAVIAGVVAAHSVQAAPAGLAGTVCATVANGSLEGSTLALAKGLLKLLTWTKAKVAGVIGAALVLTTAAIERDQVPALFHELRGSSTHVAYDDMRRPVVSPDARHVAYVVKKSDQWLVVLDGREEQEYDDIADVTFSPDGGHVAYAAKTGAKRRVIWDAKPGGEYAELHTPVFSLDGKHLAYGARRGQTWAMVRNGRESGDEDEILAPVFSPDGKRLAYAAKTDGKWFAVLDGQRQGPYEEFRGPSFSADGKSLAYSARQDGDRWRVVVDDIAGAKDFDELRAPFFSPAGRRLAFAARWDEAWHMVVDGQSGKPYPRDIRDPLFSPDGKHVAYAGKVPDGWHMVVDDREGEAYAEDIHDPVFSADGKHVAYAGKTSAGWRVVVDGEQGPAFRDDIHDPIFSADGKHVAYAGNNNSKWRVVADGHAGPEYQDFLQPPVFSADGKHLAYAAEKDEKWRLVLDGKEGELCDYIYPPFFSPDGKHVVYPARKGDRWRLVMQAL